MNIVKPGFILDEYLGHFGSLTNLNAIWTAIAPTINLIDASNNVSLSIQYMDGSLALRDTQITLRSTNASVNSALLTNASLGLANISYATNASVNSAFLKNASLGLANISYATNASVNSAFLKNASLGNNLKYRADLGVGLRNASGNLYDVAIIDTSLYIKIGATSWVQAIIKTGSLG